MPRRLVAKKFRSRLVEGKTLILKSEPQIDLNHQAKLAWRRRPHASGSRVASQGVSRCRNYMSN